MTESMFLMPVSFSSFVTHCSGSAESISSIFCSFSGRQTSDSKSGLYSTIVSLSSFKPEPFPELELPRKQYRAGIQQSGHFLYFVFGGCTIVHVAHDGCIVFLPSEWYYHPATNLHFIRPFVGQGVGEAAVQR